MDKKSLLDSYAEFMGFWMAGSAVGYFLGKIATAVLVLWFLSKLFC